MKKLVVALIIIILAFSFAGKSNAVERPINDIYVIIFVMDGYNYNTFMRGIENGHAPTIKKHFFDDGAVFDNAISTFPSASPNAYLAAVSGLFSGHSGTMYLDWFDRPDQRSVNYFTLFGQKHLEKEMVNLRTLLDPAIDELYPPSTIFEQLKDYQTASIYSFCSIGSKIKKPKNPIPALWSVFGSGREELLDQFSFNEIFKLFDKPREEFPRFILAGLYGFDSHGHHYGADSKILDYSLEQFDDLINQLFDQLKQKGIFDKTYFVILADHGMHTTPKSKFYLKDFVKSMGLNIFPAKPGEDDADAYVSSRGIGSAHIYIKNELGWNDRATIERIQNYPLKNGSRIDIIKKLIYAPEIKFVVARDGFDKVHVFSADGHGIIKHFTTGDADYYNYTVEKGYNDPLEIEQSPAAPLVGQGYFSAEKWGRKTAGNKYPDAIVQLGQVFDDGRAGDLFVIAEKDWVFFRKKKATHGTIAKDDMHIPLILRGPTIPKGKFGFARITDIYPTMLEWYGLKDNKKHDGKNLFNRGPEDVKKQVLHAKKRNEIIQKLEKIRSQLEAQKKDPAGNNYAPGLVLDANLWLVGQQLKRFE